LFFAAKIGFFYACFYGVLAALVAVCMVVFLRTLDPRIPKWQLHESLIGTNPGKLFARMFAWLVIAVCTTASPVDTNNFDELVRLIKLFSSITLSGLGFRPLPPEDNVESTLIWYRGTNKENFQVWTDALDEFLSRKSNR
jgi:sodium/potassium-transporting ATPase subunit beta